MTISFADLEAWRARCLSYGWAACPLLFGMHHDFVTRDPTSSAVQPTVTRSLSVAVPHPQYGMMRATMYLTSAPSLTRLAAIAHEAAGQEFATCSSLPHLYVGATPFVDRVDGTECVVVGILVYRKHLAVEAAPLALARWCDMLLPYFEDGNQWVMTGWDRIGQAVEVFKPFGWGCALVRAGGGDLTPTHSRVAECSTSDNAEDATTAESRHAG
jgi:hypothetical protein